MRRRVLAVRLRSLGDAVLTTPLLRVLRRGGCETGVVVERPFHAVFEGHPDVDVLFTVPGRSPAARVRLLSELRRFRADLALDLHGGTTAALLTRFSGAPTRVGFSSARWSRLYTVQVPDPIRVWGRGPLHTVEHQLTLLKYLDFPVSPIPSLVVPVDATERIWADAWLKRSGISEGFVLVHPAAAFETKQWPLDRFATLAVRLLKQGDQVVVTAGPGEENLLTELERLVGNGVTILPPAPLRRFAAVAARCGLYVGNDTGATHLTAALGKDIVVIFGSSNPVAWRPWGVRYRLVRSTQPCIPCPGYRCLRFDSPRCIQDVPVEAVWNAIHELRSGLPDGDDQVKVPTRPSMQEVP